MLSLVSRCLEQVPDTEMMKHSHSFLIYDLQIEFFFLFHLQIAVSIVSSILLSYTKLTISTMMRDHGKQALFWCGISIQAGSCIGALVMFPLVNILKLFHQGKSC